MNVSDNSPAAKAGRSGRGPVGHVRTVVIDPGHGGKDPGARGVTGSDEKDITLTIAQMVAERLSEDPQIRVVLTRTDDTYVSLEQRTAIANAQGADLFLSIHGNASENPQLAGVETYTLNNTDDRATIRLAALENGLALTGASPGERDLAYIQQYGRESRLAPTRDSHHRRRRLLAGRLLLGHQNGLRQRRIPGLPRHAG